MQIHLADQFQTVLILRLTVNQQRQMQHGEVVDLNGEVIGRFTEWSQLLAVVQTWLVNRANNQTG